jgi:hypothetical protein
MDDPVLLSPNVVSYVQMVTQDSNGFVMMSAGLAIRCYLSLKTNKVKECIDGIMECVLDFSAHMRNAFWSRENVDLIDDNLFMQVSEVLRASLILTHSHYL